MDNVAKKLAVFAACALIGAGLVWFGIHVGRATAPKPKVQAVSVAVGCSKTPEAVAKRNAVWRAWSGDASEVTPEVQLAAAIGIIIRPEIPAEVRNVAITRYMNKSVMYFSKEEIQGLADDLAGASQEKRMAAILRITRVDLEAAQLVSCVLADTERVNLWLAEKPVPPEEPEATQSK